MSMSRRRKLYSLTADSRAALRQWLSEPVGERFQLRNIGELDRIAERFGDAAPDLAGAG
ncbi:hypothetical protein AB0F17_56630 [Nonomuraea sp. NPDC026600]|uniref:hypothetical protein n=1 Tax=Nonomuraea sp. NPDC026600 TaxID=3155363 RepID=UPI0033DBFD95